MSEQLKTVKRICSNNQYLIDEPEVREIIEAWQRDLKWWEKRYEEAKFAVGHLTEQLAIANQELEKIRKNEFEKVWGDADKNIQIANYCCRKCNPELIGMVMFLCKECGNKRCPKATDHNLECTNSNELGQEGSIY